MPKAHVLTLIGREGVKFFNRLKRCNASHFTTIRIAISINI